MDTAAENREEFLAAARAQAWPERNDDCPDCAERAGRQPRMIIHSMRGTLGADWDLQNVLDLIEEASDVWWIGEDTETLGDIIARATGHTLAVREYDGKVIRFAVSKP